jgi:hypothetical protein
MIAAGMNLIAALMALFVLKPMRRRFLQRQLATASNRSHLEAMRLKKAA